ncbi:MAG: hypothetical protein AAF441_24610 [Pseudomonadota bacterium]
MDDAEIFVSGGTVRIDLKGCPVVPFGRVEIPGRPVRRSPQNQSFAVLFVCRDQQFGSSQSFRCLVQPNVAVIEIVQLLIGEGTQATCLLVALDGFFQAVHFREQRCQIADRIGKMRSERNRPLKCVLCLLLLPVALVDNAEKVEDLRVVRRK